MRTGLEPNKPADIFSLTRPIIESNKSNDWLGLKSDSDEDDQLPPRGVPQKVGSVITTLAKKTPVAPKKSVLDGFLDDDRRFLTEKTPITPTIASNNTAPTFWLDERPTSTKRPATAGIQKTSSFTDNQPTKSSIKSSFDTKPDPGNLFYLQKISFLSLFS
jgi:hypothetical protein